MAQSAGNLSMHISNEFRFSFFPLLARIRESHSIACRGLYHSSALLRHTKYHSWIREEDLGQVVATRRPSLDQKSQSSIIAAPLKCNSSDTEMVGQTEITGNIMEPPELEVDLSPSQQFRDIDFRDREGDFRILVESEDCQTKSKTRKAMQDAEKFTIAVLAKRALTAVELQKKLRAKNFTPDVIDYVVTDLQRSGLLNDYLYAESFSRSKWSSLNWGPRTIKQALLRRGVNESDADKAIKKVFEDEDCDQVPHLGMSKPSVDQLFDQAVKQWVKGENVPLEKRKTRLVRWLQYRGFNWKVTNFVLKKLEAQAQALLHKGVNEADADKAIKQVFEDDDCDQVPPLGMSKPSTDELIDQAVKQWVRGGNIPLEKRKARLVRWLQYRRFNWQVTNFVLKKLESQYPPKGA